MLKNYRIRDYDFKLIFMILALAVIGVLAIGSAEPALQSKQLWGVAAGALLMIGISFINYSLILKFYWVLYAANIVLLVMVLFAGDDAGGAQRWLEIGGLRFQPSETAKIILILFFAQFIIKNREKLNTFKVLLSCLVLIGIPWALIFKQPDLSTSVVLILVFCVIMFSGGISHKIVFGILGVLIPTAIILIYVAMQPDQTLLKDYQQDRIMAFINPEEYENEEAYQQLNSIMAIGSGQLNGKGYKNNEITSVKNGNFISEAQTDFVFAVIGEEFGFKGCVTIVVLLFGIALECLFIGRKSRDLAGKVIASSMGGLVAFQGFFNIGVATFLLPNTGLPLPFVSYGLTSLWSLFAGMGVVLNIRLQAGKNQDK